jgi:N6-adenosine-specific RNA methylase IME4
MLEDIIAELYPDCSRIELFARTAAPGWAAWGNQAPAMGRIMTTTVGGAA